VDGKKEEDEGEEDGMYEEDEGEEDGMYGYNGVMREVENQRVGSQ
jgi:hypothetical protein